MTALLCYSIWICPKNCCLQRKNKNWN